MAKRMTSSLFLLAALAGCQMSGAMESGGSNLDEGDFGGRPIPRPMGTFRPSSNFEPSEGTAWTVADLGSLTFLVDRGADGRIQKRFHAEVLRLCSQGGPCPSLEIEGTYEFKYGGTDKDGREYDYVYLHAGDHGELRFAYYESLDEETLAVRLHLRQVRTKDWAVFDYTPAAAWCGAPSDCQAQELPHPRCPGAWSCQANTCVYAECGPFGPPQPACPLTGVLCTEDCIDGQTPGGAPCNLGVLDEQTCECQPISAE